MKSRMAALAAASLLLSAPLSARNVAESMPSETHVAFWVDDLSTALESAEKNPLYRFLTHEQHGAGQGQEAIGGVIERLPISDADPMLPLWDIMLPAIDTGLRGGLEAGTSVFQFSARDILETFGNSFAIYSTMYDLYIQEGTEIVEWDVVLAADFPEEDRAKVEQFLEKALANVPPNARRREADYFGQRVFQIQYYLDEAANLPSGLEGLPIVQEVPVMVEYAFVDNVFLLAEGRGAPLQRAVRALVEEPGPFQLSSSRGFRQAEAALDGTEGLFHFYFNLAHHVREWRDFPNMGEDVRLVSALGLSDVGPILVRGRLDDSGTRLTAALVTPNEPAGMFAVLTQGPENTFRDVRFIPAEAESFASLAIDVERLYEELFAVMSVMNPQGRVVIDTILRGLEGYTNINIKRDIVSGSAGELISYIRTIDGRATSGILVPLKGETETIDAVNAIAQRLTDDDLKAIDVESSDFNGHRLWETRTGPMTPANAPQSSFAMTPQGMIFTNSGAEARDFLRRTSGESAEHPSVAGEEKYAKFLQQIRGEGMRGFVYTKIDPLLRTASEELPADAARRAFGDAWWTMRAQDRSIIFSYNIELPDSAN